MFVMLLLLGDVMDYLKLSGWLLFLQDWDLERERFLQEERILGFCRKKYGNLLSNEKKKN